MVLLICLCCYKRIRRHSSLLNTVLTLISEERHKETLERKLTKKRGPPADFDIEQHNKRREALVQEFDEETLEEEQILIPTVSQQTHQDKLREFRGPVEILTHPNPILSQKSKLISKIKGLKISNDVSAQAQIRNSADAGIQTNISPSDTINLTPQETVSDDESTTQKRKGIDVGLDPKTTSDPTIYNY